MLGIDHRDGGSEVSGHVCLGPGEVWAEETEITIHYIGSVVYDKNLERVGADTVVLICPFILTFRGLPKSLN